MSHSLAKKREGNFPAVAIKQQKPPHLTDKDGLLKLVYDTGTLSISTAGAAKTNEL